MDCTVGEQLRAFMIELVSMFDSPQRSLDMPQEVPAETTAAAAYQT